jgi:hypothetical protein
MDASNELAQSIKYPSVRPFPGLLAALRKFGRPTLGQRRWRRARDLRAYRSPNKCSLGMAPPLHAISPRWRACLLVKDFGGASLAALKLKEGGRENGCPVLSSIAINGSSVVFFENLVSPFPENYLTTNDQQTQIWASLLCRKLL